MTVMIVIEIWDNERGQDGEATKVQETKQGAP